MGTQHCYKERHVDFKSRRKFYEILCRSDYSEITVSSFAQKIQSEYYSGNMSVSIEGIVLKKISYSTQSNIRVKGKVKESYGFLPDERRSAKQNALVILTTMEKWFYVCRPTNLAFHDLTIGKVVPRALQSLLGLGVNFCPTPLRPTLNIE